VLQAPDELGHELRRLRGVYRALGDETRLRVIAVLAEFGPMPVNELSTRVVLSQPLISWHLRIMRLAGIIETRRQGREVICSLRAAAFDELHEAEARLLAGTHPSGAHSVGPASGTQPVRAGSEELPDVG
jgi:DNA-binding transcriptional ArsR family regulator